MGTQSLAQSEMTAHQEMEQATLVEITEQVRNRKQSSINSVIIIKYGVKHKKSHKNMGAKFALLHSTSFFHLSLT